MDVNLTCLQGTWEDNATFTWKLENRTLGLRHPNREVAGGRLLLKSVRYRDSGNYSCFRGGHMVQNIHLLVVETMETPHMFCSRKFPVSTIRCEWRPSSRPSPATKAVLLVHKGFNKEPNTEPCSYISSMQRFVCRLKLGEGDHSHHIVFMCVTSTADSQFSSPQQISGYSVLQPDPPVNVTVKAVEGAPQKLTVTWKYPPTWNPVFYKLKFQVKYKAEHTTFTTIVDTQMKPSCLISDALMGRKHLVQVRAREEFSHGSWSHWSKETTCTPWMDPAQLEEESSHTSFPTDYSTEDMNSYSTGDYNYRDIFYVQTAINGRPTDTAMDLGELQIPQYTFFIAGASLALGIILFVGIMIRYKKKWQQDSLKGGTLQYIFAFCPLCKMTHEEPKPASNTIPLVSPPSSPISNSPADDSRDSSGAYDVTNLNYFFLSR
ncbi:interleukin-6 receptor subunit alpha isoform X3 [Ambystoma mexicanum]